MEGEGATHSNLSPWCSECLPACDIYFILGCRWQIWAYIFIHFFIVPWMWLMMDEALFVPHSPDNPCRGRGWDPGYEALIYCFSGPGSGTCHWYRGCLMIWTQSSRDSNTQILHTHWAVSPVITVTAWSTAGGCSTLWQRNWDFQRNSRHDSIQSKENESWLYFFIVIHSCSVLLLPCFLW